MSLYKRTKAKYTRCFETKDGREEWLSIGASRMLRILYLVSYISKEKGGFWPPLISVVC